MTSTITDNCYGRGLKCNVMSNFVEEPINGYYLSFHTKSENEIRKAFDKDEAGGTTDLISVGLDIERGCFYGSGKYGNGKATEKYLDKVNLYGKRR